MIRRASQLNHLTHILLLLVCVFLFCPTAYADDSSLEGSFFTVPENTRESVFAGHNVMVIVPHQDDCINLCSGVFEDYLDTGSTVRVVYLTNGDFGGKSWANRRIHESITAMDVIGIPPENLIYLGYGDQWYRNVHIYNSKPNKVLTSKAKQNKTYGTREHEAYAPGTPYTRNNLKKNLRSVIEEFLPDTLFCIDLDGHKDHRATSLFFEEVMGEILKDRSDYTPTVFKGFGYDTAWYAVKDFYAENPLSTAKPGDSDLISVDPVFRWSKRIRFPVATESIGRFQKNTTTYRMLEKHESQNGAAKGPAIINGDKVYWLRDTSSLLYRAKISATSGNTSLLNDFKLMECPNVSARETVISGNVWIPAANDNTRSVTVTLSEPSEISLICLYDNPDLSSNILDALITLSNGVDLHSGPLTVNGSATVISFDPAQITGFSVTILESEGSQAGLTEIEAYEAPQNHGIRWIKLVDSSDNFVYDYWMPESGRMTFTVYSFPESLSSDGFSVEWIGDDICSASVEGNKISVICPEGRSIELTVRSIENPDLYDSVRISNPSIARRLLLKTLQSMEQESA